MTVPVEIANKWAERLRTDEEFVRCVEIAASLLDRAGIRDLVWILVLDKESSIAQRVARHFQLSFRGRYASCAFPSDAIAAAFLRDQLKPGEVLDTCLHGMKTISEDSHGGLRGFFFLDFGFLMQSLETFETSAPGGSA